MATQPNPNVTLSGMRARLSISHRDEYCDPTRQEVDEAHVHSLYEIYVNLSGDVSFLHGDRLYDIAHGDVIFSRPGDVHCCIYRTPCVHEHICIWFEGEDGTLGEYVERLAIPPYVRPAEQERNRIIGLLRRVEDGETDPVLRAAYFAELLSCLGVGTERQEGEGDGQESRVREILAYIEAHATERLSAARIAKAFFISESTLNRLFRTQVGLTVAHLIEANRLSHAERLLREDMTVTEACYASGFSDCSRFIARFRNKFGMTPLQYKKRMTVEHLP